MSSTGCFSNISLTKIKPGDTRRLSSLHAHCFNDYWKESEFSELLAIDGTSGLIAQCANRDCGLVLWRQLGDQAEILTLGVHPDFRRHGIGIQLVQITLGQAACNRIKEIFLEVSTGNAGAISLYERSGFKNVGIRQNYYDSGEMNRDALVLMWQAGVKEDDPFLSQVYRLPINPKVDI